MSDYPSEIKAAALQLLDVVPHTWDGGYVEKALKRDAWAKVISDNIAPLIARERAAALREAAMKLDGPGTFPMNEHEKAQAGMAGHLRRMADAQETKAKEPTP